MEREWCSGGSRKGFHSKWLGWAGLTDTSESGVAWEIAARFS